MTPAVSRLPPPLVEAAVKAALLEDLGLAGDITTAATIPPDAQAEATIAARQSGVVAGLALAEAAFRQMDAAVTFNVECADGAHVEPGGLLGRVTGPAQPILTAERVALNFLGHLSGIATLTRRFADAIGHTKARMTCTRKTTPGLRAFEKHAVRCGGGVNHRFGLNDAILIKDNHIAVAGGVGAAIARASAFAGHLVKIEVEVDTLDQLRVALDAGADVILLDNMSPETLHQAAQLANGNAVLEASGGITLQTVAAVAESGVDFISSGALTHSAPTLDLGLDIAID